MDPELDAKYFPRKNTKKPESINDKFELIALTGAVTDEVVWGKPEDLYPGDENQNQIGLFYQKKNDLRTKNLREFDLSAFGYAQKNFLQDSWLLAVVCSLCQQKSAKEWLKKVFTSYDANLHSATSLKFRLKNPLLDPAEQEWEEVSVGNNLWLSGEKKSATGGKISSFIGVNWNFTPVSIIGAFWAQYFELALANLVGSYGDLHGASLDNFHIFESLLDAPEVEACEIPDPNNSENLDSFLKHLLDSGKTNLPMVLRFRKEKMLDIHPEGSQYEILGVYEQYCTIIKWDAYRVADESYDATAKWLFEIRDFYEGDQEFPYELNIIESMWLKIYMDPEQKKEFDVQNLPEHQKIMFDNDFRIWFDKIWVCTIQDWVFV